MGTGTRERRRFRPADGLAAGVWVLGVAARVWGAWATRCLTEPDPGVVALMARHMAALKEFPVFFYGQSYMGSLEPMASALMVRLLGSTGFAVALGPVLFASAALFFLWRWARDAAGPWGGVAALLAGLWGPSVYFQFQMAPRGGYMVALFVDALALWASARMATRLREGGTAGWGRYLALGLLAGLGMWSNMIVAPALMASALVLLLGMRGRFWRHGAGIVSGLAGFVAGFSPWIVYNVRHRGASLAMSQIGGHDPAIKSLHNIWSRFLQLQDAGTTAAGPHLPLVLALAGLGLAAVGAGVAAAQAKRATPRENFARLAALSFCAIFAWVFATSGFTRTRTGRYWVPLVPGLAALSAVACAAPGGRARRGAAWGALGALTVAQGGLCLSALRESARHAEPGLAAYREIGAALDRAGVDALLAPIQLYAMNFALEERFAISNGKQKFYEPILRRAELSDAPAYSSDFNGIEAFLRQLGAEWESAGAGGRRILWNVRLPAVWLREIAGDRTLHLLDDAGADWKMALGDRNLDTGWSPGAERGGVANATLEWAFAQPQDVHSVRLVFSHGFSDEAFDFPRRIRIEAKEDGDWRTLLADEPIVPLEWSGTRAYFPEGLARLEYRVEAKAAEALRIGLLDAQARLRSLGWRLAELSAFAAEAAPPPPADAAALEALCERVCVAWPEPVVYAPRWVSNHLHLRGCARDGRLAGLSSRVFGAERDVPRDGAPPADKSGWFVVEGRHARATREALVAQGVRFQEAAQGPWTLFSVDAEAWGFGGLEMPPALLWTGDTLLAGNATARAGRALRLLRSADVPEETKKELMADVVRFRPSALSGLTEEETARWGGEAAVRARASASRFPQERCATEFANGVRLEGVDLSSGSAEAGTEVVVRLYWSAREGFEAGDEIVFIHFRDRRGKMVAQDDYRGSPMLWGNAAGRPAAGECVQEVRRIAIPAGAGAGPLSLSVGLYRPGNGRRVKVTSSEAPEVRRRAPAWPDRLRIDP